MAADPEALDLICRNEAFVAWMYLDTRGVVTCGYGHALFSSGDALRVPWDQPESQVRADYAAVLEAPAARLARFYEPLSKSRLTEPAARSLTTSDLLSILMTLVRLLPEYAS